MLTQLALTALLAVSSTNALPHKRSDSTLSCVNQLYTGPFTSTGLNGYIHLFASVIEDGEVNDGTRLGISEDGTLQDCGDCRSTQQFGFEVCQGPDRKGLDGLGNAPNSFYGHILYTTNQADIQCLTATSPFNGSSLTATECEYDYDNAAHSGQYWQIAIGDQGQAIARLANDETSGTLGINPDVINGTRLTLFEGEPDAPFSYLSFKAPEF